MLSKEAIAELEAKHKRVAVVRGQNNAWEVVFRKPTRAEYKQFRAGRASNNPDAQERLARQAVVHPSPDAFDALLDEWPAIPEAASEALSTLLGLATSDDLK